MLRKVLVILGLALASIICLVLSQQGDNPSIKDSAQSFWKSIKENVPESFKAGTTRFDEGSSTLSLCFSEPRHHTSYYVVVPHLSTHNEILSSAPSRPEDDESNYESKNEFHFDYILDRYGASLRPGQQVHLAHYYRGKLFMVGGVIQDSRYFLTKHIRKIQKEEEKSETIKFENGHEGKYDVPDHIDAYQQDHDQLMGEAHQDNNQNQKSEKDEMISSFELRLKTIDGKLIKKTPYFGISHKNQKVEGYSTYEHLLDSLIESLTIDDKMLLDANSNLTLLSLPHSTNPFHYYSEIDVKHSSPNSPSSSTAIYSTFLTAFASSHSKIPSLYDLMLSKLGLDEWRMYQKVRLSSSMVIYLNRFRIDLESSYSDDDEKRINHRHHQDYLNHRKPNYIGVIDSVIYGNYFHLDLSIDLVFHKSSKQFDLIKLIQRTIELDQTVPAELSQLGMNATLWSQSSGKPVVMLNVTLDKLLDLIHSEKQMLMWAQKNESSVKEARENLLPIGVTVKRNIFDTELVSFVNTQCVGSQTYPLQILVIMSNILLAGTLVALLVSVFLLSIMTYILSSSVCYIASGHGHASFVPPFVCFIPVRIHLMSLRWPSNWQFNRGIVRILEEVEQDEQIIQRNEDREEDNNNNNNVDNLEGEFQLHPEEDESEDPQEEEEAPLMYHDENVEEAPET